MPLTGENYNLSPRPLLSDGESLPSYDTARIHPNVGASAAAKTLSDWKRRTAVKNEVRWPWVSDVDKRVKTLFREQAELNVPQAGSPEWALQAKKVKQSIRDVQDAVSWCKPSLGVSVERVALLEKECAALVTVSNGQLENSQAYHEQLAIHYVQPPVDRSPKVGCCKGLFDCPDGPDALNEEW